MIDAIEILECKYADVGVRESYNVGEKLFFQYNGETIVVEVHAEEGKSQCGQCFFNVPYRVCPRWGCGVNDVVFVEIC
jgi:hypothetical protein